MYLFIRKRKNKKGLITYCLTLSQRDPNTGMPKQKCLESFSRKKDAEQRLIEEKAKTYTNDFIIPVDITTYIYLNEWLENRRDTISVTTYARYLDIINRDIKNTIGMLCIQKVSPLHIDRLYRNLRKRLSNKTILQYHRMLHKAFNDAYKKQIISKNPFDLIDAPKPDKYKAKILTQEEAISVITAARDERIEVPLHLGLGLGLRASEILGLTWDKVNFNKKTITIDQALVIDKSTRTLHFKKPKSETSIRVLTVPDAIFSILDKQKKKQKLLQLSGVINEFNLVFTRLDGRPMSSDGLSSIYRDFLEKYNLPKVRFHDLRHTNASFMLKAGISPKVASNRLGHSSIGITMDLYTHVLEELDHEAADNIAHILYK